MLLNSTLQSDWLIPIATNLIAALLIFLIKPTGRLFAFLAKKGVNTFRKTFLSIKNQKRIALLKYSTFVGISFINIPLNCYFVWQKVNLPGLPNRFEVLELIAMSAIVIFWTVDFIYKWRNYDVSDYLVAKA